MRYRVVLTDSSSSRASVSPVVLLKLLVLDEEREMLGLPLLLLHSFNFVNALFPPKTKQNKTNKRLKIQCSTKELETILLLLSLTSLCWGRSQVSWDWKRSLTSLPATVGRSLEAFGHCWHTAHSWKWRLPRIGHTDRRNNTEMDDIHLSILRTDLNLCCYMFTIITQRPIDMFQVYRRVRMDLIKSNLIYIVNNIIVYSNIIIYNNIIHNKGCLMLLYMRVVLECCF